MQKYKSIDMSPKFEEGASNGFSSVTATQQESVRSLLSLLDEKPPSHHFSCQLECVHYLTGLEKHETILTPLHAPGDKKTYVLDFLMAEFAEVINREMVHTAIDDMWHII